VLAAVVLPLNSGLARSPVQPKGLTLPLAVEIALRSHPLTRAAASGREMADARLSEARAGRFPVLEFSETFLRGNNRIPSNNRFAGRRAGVARPRLARDGRSIPRDAHCRGFGARAGLCVDHDGRVARVPVQSAWGAASGSASSDFSSSIQRR
jgi:hypothetical protein